MTREELDKTIDEMYGFVHYDDKLNLFQVVVDDISLWFTQAQIDSIDVAALNVTIAKRVVSLLKSGEYPWNQSELV